MCDDLKMHKVSRHNEEFLFVFSGIIVIALINLILQLDAKQKCTKLTFFHLMWCHLYVAKCL